MAELKVIDSSGLDVEGRIRELLCSDCAARFSFSAAPRNRRLRLRPGQAVVFGGVAAIVVRSVKGQGTSLQVYMPATVSIKRTKESVIDRFLAGMSDGWEGPACTACQSRLRENGWEEVEVELTNGQDLAFPGLGWLAVRKESVTLRAIVPTGAYTAVRPQICGGTK